MHSYNHIPSAFNNFVHINVQIIIEIGSNLFYNLYQSDISKSLVILMTSIFFFFYN